MDGLRCSCSNGETLFRLFYTRPRAAPSLVAYHLVARNLKLFLETKSRPNYLCPKEKYLTPQIQEKIVDVLLPVLHLAIYSKHTFVGTYASIAVGDLAALSPHKVHLFPSLCCFVVGFLMPLFLNQCSLFVSTDPLQRGVEEVNDNTHSSFRSLIVYSKEFLSIYHH